MTPMPAADAAAAAPYGLFYAPHPSLKPVYAQPSPAMPPAFAPPAASAMVSPPKVPSPPAATDAPPVDAFAQSLSPSSSRRLRLASRAILMRAAADLVAAWRGWAAGQQAKGLAVDAPPLQVVQAIALLRKAREALARAAALKASAAAEGEISAPASPTASAGDGDGAGAAASAAGGALAQAVARLPYPARTKPTAGLPAPKARRPAQRKGAPASHAARRASPSGGALLKRSGAGRVGAFRPLSAA